jgi:hypothetical protein
MLWRVARIFAVVEVTLGVDGCRVHADQKCINLLQLHFYR